MAKARKGDYFGLGRFISVIFAIIPVTAWIFGVITRFKEGKILAGIIRLIGGFNIIWVLDIIFILFFKKILRVIPI